MGFFADCLAAACGIHGTGTTMHEASKANMNGRVRASAVNSGRPLDAPATTLGATDLDITKQRADGDGYKVQSDLGW